MKCKDKNQNSCPKERSLGEDNIVLDSFPVKMQQSLRNQTIEKRTIMNKNGENLKLHLTVSETLTDEQIEAIKELLSSINFEVNIEAGDEFADKSLDNLLFIAALASPPELREEVLGHLTERYRRDVTRFGEKRAKTLLGRDVVTSWLSDRSQFVQTLGEEGMKAIVKYFLS